MMNVYNTDRESVSVCLFVKTDVNKTMRHGNRNKQSTADTERLEAWQRRFIWIFVSYFSASLSPFIRSPTYKRFCEKNIDENEQTLHNGECL